MTEDELNALVAKMNGKPGDLLLFAADKNKIVWNVLGALRLQLGEELGLIDENKYNFLWVTEFPLLEWSDEENRFMAMHHPFTMPMEEDGIRSTAIRVLSRKGIRYRIKRYRTWRWFCPYSSG